MRSAIWLVMWAGCVVGDSGSGARASFKQSPGAPDPSGTGGTFSTSGAIDPDSLFFVSLGTNGRFCGACHDQAEGWTITPAGLQTRFSATNGTDPIFRLVDGANAPTADVSTVAARRSAYSMLLSRGVIRVGLRIPAGAEFELVAVDDPYGYASASQLSLFRRPLPSTNLRFLSVVMWDGRETSKPFDLTTSLASQARDATLGHAQASSTDPTQMASITSFEQELFTAQVTDSIAGPLSGPGAHDGGGGPELVSQQAFYIGINDPLGLNPTGAAFDPNVFTLFDSWSTEHAASAQSQRRASIYRGQQLFNTRPIQITGVNGLNDALGMPVVQGTCTTCHDTPNIGDHSVAAPLNIGIADGSRRTPDMPLYTLRNRTTGEVVTTTDPGRALITGKWADIGKFKGPVLRGLALRAPYFHNGSAATLDAVLDFYDDRFALGLSAQEKSDLVAFLSAL